MFCVSVGLFLKGVPWFPTFFASLDIRNMSFFFSFNFCQDFFSRFYFDGDSGVNMLRYKNRVQKYLSKEKCKFRRVKKQVICISSLKFDYLWHGKPLIYDIMYFNYHCKTEYPSLFAKQSELPHQALVKEFKSFETRRFLLRDGFQAIMCLFGGRLTDPDTKT